MPRKYHAIASRFAAGPLADFCAAYYVVVTTFGNHRDDIRADEYERLRDLPPKRYGKRSAFRLFYLRRYLQKALELMEFSDTLRLCMFDLPREQLQCRHNRTLEGIIIDSWTRPQAEEAHVEFIIYTGEMAPLRHVSCPRERVDELIGTRAASEGDEYKHLRSCYRLEVTGYNDLRYVSRLYVPNRYHVELHKLTDPATVPQLIRLTLTPKGADTIAQSICSSTSGEITFELFSLYESDDPKHLSEMCFYAVEPLRFMSREVDPESHLHARLICMDDLGHEYEYRAEWNRVRRLEQGQYLLALTKRIWNTPHRFILEFELITVEASAALAQAGEKNFHVLEKQFVFTAAKELLALLPREGAEYPVGQLTVGQWVMHPDYGPGIVEVFEETDQGHMARFHFFGRHYDNGRILIPTSTNLPAYWTDVALF